MPKEGEKIRRENGRGGGKKEKKKKESKIWRQ